jgi:amino acid adenylation domain-containing protein
MSAHSIPEAFAAIAASTPQRVALCGDGPPVSYGELAARANGVAARLAALGIGAGDRVGLYANRGADAIAAILGVLRCGAAYVPLDTSYPTNLLRFIYEDSAPAAMLVDPTLVRADTPAFWRGAALPLQPTLGDAVAAPPARLPAGADPAYVMYTSGSSGRPKGVLVPHRAVLRLVLGNDYAQLGPEAVILQLAPLSFDACNLEIWGALLNGGRLAILANPYPSLAEIGAAIAAHEVSTLWLTAGLFHLMVDNNLAGLAPLRQLIAGGDVLSPPHVVRALRALPECRLVNGYGPTENTTFSCCYTVPRDYAGEAPLPIGRAIRGTDTYVLDEQQRPLVAGSEGELCVGGAGLALGYLNRPELTARSFVPHPQRPGERLYRTGDRVRERVDGNLEFLGRIDRQVKINGKRVELDEIEARLRASALVQDAAVVAEDAAGGGQRRIVAFVTTSQGTLDEAALRRALRAELPDFMQPAAITQLPALPLSPTGKVDRARLPHLASREIEVKGRAPQGATEALLLEVWKRVLGRNEVGVEDNFFDLGGTSLGLMEVHASITRSLASDLTVIEMFQYPRISALAARLARSPIAPAAALGAAERARLREAALARRPARKTQPP